MDYEDYSPHFEENSSDNESERDVADIEIALYGQLHFDTISNTEPSFHEADESFANLFVIDIVGREKKEDASPEKEVFEITEAEESGSVKDPSLSTFSDSLGLDSTDRSKLTLKERKKLLVEQLKGVVEIDNNDDDDDDDDEVNRNSGPEIIDLRSDEEDVLIVLDEDTDDHENRIQLNVKKHQISLFSRPPKLKGADTECTDEKWNIGDKDKASYKKALSRGRYYSTQKVRCRNCDQIGHIFVRCPNPKKKETCIFCSEVGHNYRQCTESFCFNCRTPGHNAASCTGLRYTTALACHRCHMKGHRKILCPENWRQFHMTTDGGKLMEGEEENTDRLPSCYNCGDDTHFGHECYERRIDSYSRSTLPFVYTYSKIREKIAHRQEAREEPWNKKRKFDDKKLTGESSFPMEDRHQKVNYNQNRSTDNQFVIGSSGKAGHSSTSLDNYSFNGRPDFPSLKSQSGSNCKSKKNRYKNNMEYKANTANNKSPKSKAGNTVNVSLHIGEESFPRGGRPLSGQGQHPGRFSGRNNNPGPKWNKKDKNNSETVSGSSKRAVTISSRGFKISLPGGSTQQS